MQTDEPTSADGLYERDFYSWTVWQAELLRSGKLDTLDIANIAEELDTLGRSELSALVSAYKLVTQHLLKLMLQPEKATSSWDITIKRERGKIEDILDDNPGLRSKQDEAFSKGYARGRRDAANETGIDDVDRFPKDPPFTREQAETNGWPVLSEPLRVI